jgi:hypothetical protein
MTDKKNKEYVLSNEEIRKICEGITDELINTMRKSITIEMGKHFPLDSTFLKDSVIISLITTITAVFSGKMLYSNIRLNSSIPIDTLIELHSNIMKDVIKTHKETKKEH